MEVCIEAAGAGARLRGGGVTRSGSGEASTWARASG